MGINTTLALTLSLLTLMLGAGVASGSWGYKLGREALKGITQPDVRPTNNLINNKRRSSTQIEVALLKEKDIIKNVKARMDGTDKTPDQESSKKTESKSQKKKTEKVETSVTLPLSSRHSDVFIEVSSVRQRSGYLVLDVNLKNEGSETVRFLYSFLNVTDNQGRTLSATAEDLPGELPPNSDTYQGTISIPMTLLDKAKDISLALTDYPNQKVQLKLSGIPIKE